MKVFMGNGELSGHPLLQTVLDTFTEHVAVIDTEGNILMVNEAWRRFGRQQDSRSEEATGVSANYFAACRNATGHARSEAFAALRGIEAVAKGVLPQFSLEYVCQTPAEMLWFTLTAAPLAIANGGVLISHTDVSERRRYQTLAHTDPLTGVANRRFFATFATQALESSEYKTVALVLTDLNGFKKVNDGHGHGIGDALLVAFSGRLRAGMRESDLVARLGGDEFAVVLPISNMEALNSWVKRTSAHLNEPYTLAGQTFHVKASLGITLFPLHGHDLSTLMDLADRALYRAKRRGGGVEFYQP